MFTNDPVYDHVLLLFTGGCGHLDVQPHWTTALTWPIHKGVFEGSMGLATDCLLVGRLDGSLAVIDVVGQNYRRKELEHCYRGDGLLNTHRS